MADSSLFSHSTAPTLDNSDNTDSPVTLGVIFRAAVAGTISSLWMYVANTNMSGQSGSALIYTGGAAGDTPKPLLTQTNFTFQGTVGWQEIPLDTPLSITTADAYIAAIFINGSHYCVTQNQFTTEITSGDLTAYSGTTTGFPYDVGNGRFAYGSTPTYPINRAVTYTNYWIDVTFTPGSSGSSGGVTTSASDTTPQVGNVVSLTAAPTSGTADTYTWSVLLGTGNLSSTSISNPTYTPTAPGKHILACAITQGATTRTGYLTLVAAAPAVQTTGQFTAQATDTVGAVGSKTSSLTLTRGGNVTMQVRSLYGHRMSFGDAVTNTKPILTQRDETTHAFYSGTGATYAVNTVIQRDCLLTKIRFLKAPSAAGLSGVGVWLRGTTTPLYTQTIPALTADNGGWIEIVLDRPVALSASASAPYLIGYYCSNGFVVEGEWTYGSQAIVEYPFHINSNGGGFGETGGSAFGYGGLLTYPSTATGSSFYIDPVVEWPSDDAVYTGGLEYYKRWSAYSTMNHFPIGVWRPLPESFDSFAAIGVNTSVSTGNGLLASKDGLLANNMDVYVAVDSADEVVTFRQDPALYDLIKGYFIRDEPDLIGPWTSPAELQALYTSLRRVDPTKLIILNLGFEPVLNKGFTALPVGADPDTLNQYWRQFAATTDIVSCDFYMEDPGNAGSNFGLWCNPRIVQRMQDISNHSKPVWSYIMTSGYGSQQPTPQTVYNSVWAHLIGGARGIVFFDYIFANGNGAFITDHGMATNTAMAAKVTAMCARIQSLKDALLGPETALDVAVVSSNITSAGLAGAVGGELGVPIHYTARQDSTHKYLFTQSIRPGTTTGNFTVPAAAGKTITVIDESRTISVDGSGNFTDTYSSDYAVHLYQWS